ncbi:unnamed protein product [Linum trigynum]|uniref:Uncharacterized protein n=1 Tax=Linum trigynum TaxID=586398 RepID=A0AAV2FVP2_9ROSI
MVPPTSGGQSSCRRDTEMTTENRRPPSVTSSPNTSSDKETQQTRKRTKSSFVWIGKMSFSELMSDKVWYVAESDTKDIHEAMREEDIDDEVPDEDDPRCPTIPFKAMEKASYRWKWWSALTVKVLGRTFLSQPPLGIGGPIANCSESPLI